jgi:hypothetical protein
MLPEPALAIANDACHASIITQEIGEEGRPKLEDALTKSDRSEIGEEGRVTGFVKQDGMGVF